MRCGQAGLSLGLPVGGTIGAGEQSGGQEALRRAGAATRQLSTGTTEMAGQGQQ